MSAVAPSLPVSKNASWTGRILSGLTIAFMLVDAAMKIARTQASVEGTIGLGYPESSVVGIGVALLAATVLYAIPQTAFWGALLVTGYLGGAVASNVRVGNPLFSNTLFPVYVAILLWAGLALRDRRLRALITNQH